MTATPVAAIEKYSSTGPVMRVFAIAAASMPTPRRKMMTVNGLDFLRRTTRTLLDRAMDVQALAPGGLLDPRPRPSAPNIL